VNFAKNLGKKLFTCEQCGSTKKTDQYTYQSPQYVPEYVPKIWKALCKKCLKREAGTSVFRRLGD
jgi:hypothetical protein